MILNLIIAVIVAFAIGVVLAVILNLLDTIFAEKKSNSLMKFLNTI